MERRAPICHSDYADPKVFLSLTPVVWAVRCAEWIATKCNLVQADPVQSRPDPTPIPPWSRRRSRLRSHPDPSRVPAQIPPQILLCVDSANHRVLALQPLDLQLIWVFVGSPLAGKGGSHDGQLQDPEGIAAHPAEQAGSESAGIVAVADCGNYRVSVSWNRPAS